MWNLIKINYFLIHVGDYVPVNHFDTAVCIFNLFHNDMVIQSLQGSLHET